MSARPTGALMQYLIKFGTHVIRQFVDYNIANGIHEENVTATALIITIFLESLNIRTENSEVIGFLKQAEISDQEIIETLTTEFEVNLSIDEILEVILPETRTVDTLLPWLKTLFEMGSKIVSLDSVADIKKV